MRKQILTLLLSALTVIAFSQTIECPPDVTVSLIDLDTNYESYGEPKYSGPGSYELTKNITTIDNSCNSPFQLNVTITYNLKDASTGNVQATCDQSIYVERASIDDITFPEDYTIAEGSLEDLGIEFGGQPEPIEALSLYSLIGINFNDDIFYLATGVKVLREWNIIDWCTEEVKKHVQVLKIDTVTNVNRTANVTNCNNEIVEVEDVTLRTDVVGFTIDYGTCSSTTSSLVDFVNCVAENNDIPAENNFTVEINRNGDDLNGVSTLDLVFIQRHILGISTFDSSCKMLASDINNDGSISAIDLVEMRKLILGIYSEYPDSPSWKFFNLKQIGQNASGINVINSENDLNFRKSEFPLSELNVIAIKMGDVNGSAIGN